MFYNSTFNKANLNLLIYRDLPEALKLQKMCKLNSLAVITARPAEIKPSALRSCSKWIPSFIAKDVLLQNIEENQITEDILGLRLIFTQVRLQIHGHSSWIWSLRCLDIAASNRMLRPLTNPFWTNKSRVSHAIDLSRRIKMVGLGPWTRGAQLQVSASRRMLQRFATVCSDLYLWKPQGKRWRASEVTADWLGAKPWPMWQQGAEKVNI